MYGIDFLIDLGLPPDIVSATLDGTGVEEIYGLESMIPDNMLYGPDECLKRCGLTRPEVPSRAQQQPRVAGNAFPASVLAEVPSIPTPASIALYTAEASPTASASS